MTESSGQEQHEPRVGPEVLPGVLNAGTIAEQGQVFLSLDGNPFGASLTTPHIFVARHDRGQEKYALHPSIDRLLVHLMAARRIANALVTGAEGGNLIILNLGVPASDVPEFAVYSELVDLINWLNAIFGSNEEEMRQLGRQFADLADLNRRDRVMFNEARGQTYANVRSALVTAFNHALQNVHMIVPGTGSS